jgi:RHS repeat-associated protein
MRETNPGTNHELRFVLLPENAQRLNETVGAAESQTNTVWEDYANAEFEYDSGHRVSTSKERMPGAGCGCSGGSAATTTYTWTANGGSPDPDTWNLHCVADRVDNTRVIFDVNTEYQILSWVVQDDTDGSPNYELIWHFDYGTTGATENRLTGVHYPSNCTDYDESSAPYSVTVSTSAGVVYSMDYDYTTDTYDGYPEKIQILEGTSGTANTLVKYDRTDATRPDLVTTSTVYESAGESDGRATTYAYSFFDGGGSKVQPKLITVTHPSVSAGKNGPGSSAVDYYAFDLRTGALRFAKDGEGYVRFYAYDDETGVRDLTVVDVNTSPLPDPLVQSRWDGDDHYDGTGDTDAPFVRTGSGSPLNIDSSSTIDWLGRTRKSVDADGTITYYVYKDDQVRVYPAWDTGSELCLLPISINKMDKDGRTEEMIRLSTEFDPDVTSNEPDGTTSYSNSDYVAWSKTSYNIAGSREHQDQYHDIPSSGSGTRYTNFNRTAYEYDEMGRLQYVIADVADESDFDREQVTRTYYDFVGRVTMQQEGVSSNTHNIGDGKPSLETTVEYFYDDPDSDATPEQGAGDGNLRWVRRYYGDAGGEHNDTEYRYDWRNRRCLTLPAAAPYTLVAYDHLGRVTATASYSATTNLDPGDDPATTENSTRLTLGKTYYDERGFVYKSERYDDPGDATPADALTSNTYRDRRGLTWASDGANSGVNFTEYDGAGRRVATYLATGFDAAKYDSGAPDYPDDDETLIRKVEYTLDDGGHTTQVFSMELNHDSPDGLDFTNDDNYIRTIVYNWYDAAHRLTGTANYGTYNADGWKYTASAPSYDSSPPARSDTVLVTTRTYDTAGRLATVTDPMGIVTESTFDAAGRKTEQVEDSSGPGTPLNRTTQYQYNAAGSLVRIIHDPDGDNDLANGTWTPDGDDVDQVTEYYYTDAQSARRVTEIHYATGDGTVGSTQADKIVFTYNIDGTLATRTDQNGTVLTWSYDSLRRKTEEEVTTVGSYTGGTAAVDGTVRAVTWQYTSAGKLEYLTTYSDTTPDTSSYTDALTQIKYTYDAAQRMTKVETEHDGAVDGSTKSVQYTYGTEYTTSGNYARLNYLTYPDGDKLWYGYTHSGGAGTYQDTINDKLSRVGQLAWDDSGAIGDLIAEYDFNGTGRLVRRNHTEDGTAGNDTRLDLWHGTSGDYDGFDRFGRLVDLKYVNYVGTPVDFDRREIAYDRNSNRTSIDSTLNKIDGWELTYDNLNRLVLWQHGILDSSNQVVSSSTYEQYGMDLLGNLTSAAGGLMVNTASATVTQTTDPTNEITALGQTNPAGAPTLISEAFDSLLSYWWQRKGIWSVSSGEVNVDSFGLGGGTEAILLASPTLDQANYEVKLTFPSVSTNSKAGLVFSHDGTNNYYAVVMDRANSRIALHQISGGAWGGALASDSATVAETAQYSLHVVRLQRRIEARLIRISTGALVANFAYNFSTDPGTGQAGLYSDKTDLKFDDFTVYDGAARDPQVPRFRGMAEAALSGGALTVDSQDTHGGTAILDWAGDDDYVVTVDANLNSGDYADILVRHADPNNALLVRLTASDVEASELTDGNLTSVASNSHSASGSIPMKIKLAGTSCKVWVDGTLKINTTVTDRAGGLAFAGDGCKFAVDEPLVVGYDNNADDDITDDGDDLIINEDFASSSVTYAHDLAGNLIDDGLFWYTYDPWNRLVKVQLKQDDGAVTVQQSTFDGKGRRIKKVVSNAGDFDATTVYFYDGWKIIETRNGSDEMVAQYVHGTQYIDEIVLARFADQGDLYVHQDANWNVIGLTDLGGRVVERFAYSPYGELTVSAETFFGDYDGDGDVDATDEGYISGACSGSDPSGACRILDFDKDGDVDTTDDNLIDDLKTDRARHPALASSKAGFPFAHQGLLLEPEIGSYQNRHRQYDPTEMRFMQRDPEGYIDGLNSYGYTGTNPASHRDPTGLAYSPIAPRIGEPCDVEGESGPCNVETCCRCGYGWVTGWPLFGTFFTTTTCKCHYGPGGIGNIWMENCGFGEFVANISGCEHFSRPAIDSAACNCADSEYCCPNGTR